MRSKPNWFLSRGRKTFRLWSSFSKKWIPTRRYLPSLLTVARTPPLFPLLCQNHCPRRPAQPSSSHLPRWGSQLLPLDLVQQQGPIRALWTFPPRAGKGQFCKQKKIVVIAWACAVTAASQDTSLLIIETLRF